MINQHEIDQYHRDGFVTVDDVLSTEEIAALRIATTDPRVQEPYTKLVEGPGWLHLLELTCKHEAFHALARHPRLMEVVTSVLGKDVQLQHSKLAAKREQPGTGEVPWHQDFSYFPHTNTDLCAVMVMLDDATPDNGCMQMVRGSHREGLREHHDSSGWFAGSCQEPGAWADASRIVDVMPRAGGISIHHCLTMHSSVANRSGAPRRGLVFQFRAADAMQLCDEIWADTGMQVAGSPVATVRCESACWRLRRRQQQNPFGSAWNQRGSRAG